MEVNKETLLPSVCPGHSEKLYSFFIIRGKKISNRDFRNTLIWNLLEQAGNERNVQRPVGRPTADPQLIGSEERGRKHCLFFLPREEDVHVRRKRVSPEMFQ
jgi:hypothetical protein